MKLVSDARNMQVRDEASASKSWALAAYCDLSVMSPKSSPLVGTLNVFW